MANNNIVLTSLDFDSLKQSLKNFLQNQTEFQDYNFEGAAINIILDLLAYNSHLLSFYLNMVANESFLDTAVLRSTVVSHAKSLGYTPHSATAAQATIDCTITRSNTDNTAILTLPRFTAFSSDNLNGTSYQFNTLDAVTSQVSGNTFVFNDLVIFEGTPVVKTFVVDNGANPTQTFDLVDQGIDTSTMQVIVQKSATQIQQTVFNPANSVLAVDGSSNVYYLQEGTNGNYQIYFGNDVVGVALDQGNILIVSYLITDANAANFLQNFTLVTNPLSGGTSNVITVAASAGGSPIEDVASIKFSAPKSFVAQNRAVTKNDYIALINKNYPYFDAVNIWGGEELTPPQYGKIFIAAKPKNGFALTESQKQFVITNVIDPISILTVTANFVDVDYNYIILILNVEYDSKQTTSSPGQLAQGVVSAVNNYANLNLNTFNSEFRLSRLLRAVDDTDSSIEGSDATIFIEKQFTPALNANATYTLNVGFPLHRGTTNDRLYSTPAFTILDASGISRQGFIEETPLSFSGIESIAVNTPGAGYVTNPQVLIIGDGIGANAFPIVVNRQVVSVVVDNPGNNYSTATATVIGGGGTGATLIPSLAGKKGVLRSYYFDTNQNKIIISANTGSIDYDAGIVTITNFQPTGINNNQGILKIRVQPDALFFKSQFNNILTINPNDLNATTVNMIDINNQ